MIQNVYFLDFQENAESENSALVFLKLVLEWNSKMEIYMHINTYICMYINMCIYIYI